MVRIYWKRVGIILLLAVVANLVQSLLALLGWYRQLLVDLPLLVTIFYAGRNPSSGALFMGWVTGLIQDITSGGILGINALSKLVVAYVACAVEEKLDVQEILAVRLTIIMLLVALNGVVGYLAITHISRGTLDNGVLSSNFLFSLIINPLIYMILLYFPLERRRKSFAKSG